MEKPIIVVLMIVSLFAASCTFGSDIPVTQTQNNSDLNTAFETLLDSDGDGFSDKFEERMELYDPNIPNDRYFLYCEYLPETEKESNIEFSWGRMSIIDTKPFMLLPARHSISVHKLQATGSPA